MSFQEDFVPLYSKDARGKIRQWSIGVVKDKSKVYVRSTHGCIDGEEVVDMREITEGKNMGRKNETTKYQQACKQAESKWKLKLIWETMRQYDEQRIISDIKLKKWVKHHSYMYNSGIYVFYFNFSL